jgi:trimethylamine:corrinoid methyltransferase-like protein
MSTRPKLAFLSAEQLATVLRRARLILEELGIAVEHDEATDRLAGAGARVVGEGASRRVHLSGDLVDRGLSTVLPRVTLYDRDGENPVHLGEGALAFAPGSAALRVHDFDSNTLRLATLADCERFARLTEALPDLTLQATCVVPSDVPVEQGDTARLLTALLHCRRPIVTGTFRTASFESMHAMLALVRGGEAPLAQRPLAIFDCCPTSPLAWSELSCSTLLACARTGVPAELIAVPMTGATAPVTLMEAVTQHTAENLAGLVLHQLAAPGAPLLWGACTSAFDMRMGASALAAVESTLMNGASAQVGRSLGLPTHAYLALSDAKCADYQAGLESGWGAQTAALTGLDVVSGPGLLEFAGAQSPEKLVLDHEACSMARRLVRGVEDHGASDEDLIEPLREGLAAEQFLGLDHTRRHFRGEIDMPSGLIDRQVADAWEMAGGLTAAERAHGRVLEILDGEPTAALPADMAAELTRIGQGLP